MTFDERIQEVLKYQVEGRGGKINPKDDFAGFILDIKTTIKESLPKKINSGDMWNPADPSMGKEIGWNAYCDEIHKRLGLN